MNSQHHASLGRRTLEEIRQKRAAERLSKASSGSDLSTSSNPPDNGGIKKSDSVSKLSEKDVGSLVAQIRDLQNKNAIYEDENNQLSSKLEGKEVECETLQKRLNDLEQKTVPSLRKALKGVAMEKDAAVVAREDLSAQVRTLRKRLKEAEEEQYRAEEDAAALRAELNSIQQQAINASAGSMASMGSPDQIHLLEKELTNMKLEFERELKLRQQGQQRLAEEEARVSTLVSEKQDLESKLAEVMKSASDNLLRKTSANTFTLEDKEKLESQLHDMAVMVERLESGRQKLLLEIDSQSSEIEKLFEENSSLTSAYQEAAGVASHWENQVKECLKHNEELRGMLDQLRTEQIRVKSSNEGTTVYNSNDTGAGVGDYTSEVLDLKGQLAKEQSKAESLSAEVMQLSLKLQQATRAYTNLARLYKPVLRNIENGLMKMKHDGALPVK